MTDRELFEKALEALDLLSRVPKAKRDYADRAIAALRERLAQPEQEPVAFVDPIWMQRPDLIIEQRLEIKKLFARVQVMDYVPLYTAPQPAPTIDKSAAIRIATALGWVPPSDTSQDRVDQAQKQRQEQEPVCAHDIPKIKCSFCHVEYKQPEQEPVAWVLEWIEDGEVYASKLYESERRCRYDAKKDTDAVCRPLVYGDTPPSKRAWQGLTDDEFRKVVDGLEDLEDCWVALEHALKEKNT